MDVTNSNSLAATGFLTAQQDKAHGWFGGYLILSRLGRPLEFHCTTPIEPTRAQQILYGPTLQPHLLGEVIGRTLVEQAKLPVQAVLTDLPEMLNLSLTQQEMMACVVRGLDPRKEEAPADAKESYEQPCNNSWDTDELVPHLEIGCWQLYGTSTCSWQPEQLREQIAPLVEYIDLLEPFQRIREAIHEAQRISAVEDGGASASSVAA